ncbi:putative serine/threonine-protein kinase-like protein CCR3 [Ipomoea triloba]|uniref:putative serine/threonine-protein kinase-like protein CCR3 n=1 Tax=Ipomoea triloba TaxID=35885 RepID=UPI00125D76C0|nr:putative serine/threonine-protein kinase-like protein CCR3 [Ipomoea triloba]XP_031109126.1 putative serine/threonine-protein kinase-like protein CCR3 [Ipomoea triloba]
MTTHFVAAVAVAVLTAALICPPSAVHALGGSSATLAVMYGSTVAVCGISAGTPFQEIHCRENRRKTPLAVYPNVSFDSIAGGLDVLCGVLSGGSSLVCWGPTFAPKRLYWNPAAPISAISIGDTQICGVNNQSDHNVICWRGDPVKLNGSPEIVSISSGLGFSCGVVKILNRVICWGEDNDKASIIESEFKNESMVDINAGGSFACGFNTTGFVICRGENLNGQLEVPQNSAYGYSGLSLGLNHSCGIRRLNRTVICWGGNGIRALEGISFESIISGFDFTCGLKTSDFSVVCWGPGWAGEDDGEILLPEILPGPCVQSNCSECGVYPQSQSLCSGNGNICRPCDRSIPIPIPTGTKFPAKDPKGLRGGLLASTILGSIGGFSGICTLLYCLCVCLRKQKIHNSVQPTINGGTNSPISRSSTLKRQGSQFMRRQKSGTSSKRTETAAEFAFSDLLAATNCFSLENKIGAGSFGVVYKGKLPDGRDVAIKRGETGNNNNKPPKRFQEKESAFESELVFMSRLHHKHLVKLVGFCEEDDERLLVYEFMKNGALYDHLHDKSNVEKSCSVLNSWKMRIKIALDAARGIEYLHSYAVPPIIHRDIKSSNILIDGDWTGRVADFGLSLMGPTEEGSCDYSRPMKAAGTVGYIDPEYYGLNILTAKSDVYGLGVVLLELLTGKRAIFKNGNEGVAPMSVVEYAVPVIMAGELEKILDGRVGRPERMAEAEAVELVAYTAMLCVNLEGKDRPTMADIVANLERALGLCDDSHGYLSSDEISIISE